MHVEPPCAIVVEGDHGERLSLGLSELATLERMPPEACEDFRKKVLSAFGPGGPRRLTDEIEDAAVDTRWLGPNPSAALSPEEMLARMPYPDDD